jgi:hypothetical protein
VDDDRAVGAGHRYRPLASWVALMCGALVPVTFGLLGAARRGRALAVASALCAILGTLAAAGSWLTRRHDLRLTLLGFVLFSACVAILARLGPTLLDP